MLFENLTDENVLIYAIKAYDKPNVIMSEFEQDYKRFNYINRLFTRYIMGKECKERLVINHIIIISNVFGPEVAIRLLFYKTKEKYYSLLKTYLVFLNLCPSIIHGIRGNDIMTSDIFLDMELAQILRGIR